MVKVAAIVLTKDEEARIEECLKHLRPYIDFVLVLDGESTDKTVEIAKKYADRVEVRPFSGSFAKEKNYARTLVPEDCSWILWVDADERFDTGLFHIIKNHPDLIEKLNGCWRFPRCNLPGGKDWPDYQVRLMRNDGDIEWRGETHEVPYLKSENVPIDQLDREDRGKRFSVITADGYPIIHMPRREDERRAWW